MAPSSIVANTKPSPNIPHWHPKWILPLLAKHHSVSRPFQFIPPQSWLAPWSTNKIRTISSGLEQSGLLRAPPFIKPELLGLRLGPPELPFTLWPLGAVPISLDSRGPSAIQRPWQLWFDTTCWAYNSAKVVQIIWVRPCLKLNKSHTAICGSNNNGKKPPGTVNVAQQFNIMGLSLQCSLNSTKPSWPPNCHNTSMSLCHQCAPILTRSIA